MTPKSQMLDWVLIRSFLAVVESGSLSAAAKRAGSTQPTLSRHIRELEAAVGATLFKRSVQGLEPTDAALALIEDAQAMGTAAEALSIKAAGRSQALTGTVRITASIMVGNLMLPPMLASLRRAEPEIQIELVASDANQNLLRRDADIAIRMVEPTQQALIARKVGDSPLGLFGTKEYFDRHGRIIDLKDLKRHDLIGLDRSDFLVRMFSAHGADLSREHFAVRCDDQMIGWHLMMAGAGIGIAQTLLAARHPELEMIGGGPFLAPLPIWLVMSEEVRNNARVRRVADFLAAELSSLLRGEPKGP